MTDADTDLWRAVRQPSVLSTPKACDPLRPWGQWTISTSGKSQCMPEEQRPTNALSSLLVSWLGAFWPSSSCFNIVKAAAVRRWPPQPCIQCHPSRRGHTHSSVVSLPINRCSNTLTKSNNLGRCRNMWTSFPLLSTFLIQLSKCCHCFMKTDH